MVQALINIHKDTNRVLNMIKAKYDLRTKSEAIDRMVAEYLDSLPEPPLRPEYVKKALKIMKEPIIHIGTIEDFRKRYEQPSTRSASGKKLTKR